MTSLATVESTPSNFPRLGSFKKFYRSLRRSKKSPEYQIQMVPTNNLHVPHEMTRKSSLPDIIKEDEESLPDRVGVVCPLIQPFYNDGALFDKICHKNILDKNGRNLQKLYWYFKLNFSYLSRFEQTRRGYPTRLTPFTICSSNKKKYSKQENHLYFVNGHRAKRELFCPEQASQCEIEIKSGTHHQFIVYIVAPNGERSGPIHFLGIGMKQTFSPSKVGCGHGIWTIEIHQRLVMKFQMANTEQLDLRGAGVLTFEVDRKMRLTEVERLWLNYNY